MRPGGFIASAVIGIAINGCGTAITRDYSHSIIGAGGEVVTLDDVQRIIDDPNLSDDERRQQIRDLGIEDEKLVEALLDL